MRTSHALKTAVLFLLCVGVLLHTAHALHVRPARADSTVALDGTDLQAAFKLFKSTYAKVYATANEEAVRLRNFVANYRSMLAQRAANPHATFEVNRLFDRSEQEVLGRGAAFMEQQLRERKDEERAGLAKLEEVLARRETRRSDKKRSARAALKEACAQTESDVDWRTCNAVSPVKDQGSCGSCWAFSAVGNIESQWYLNRLAASANPKSAALQTLSEQHVVSCDDLDSACMGGLMELTYQWLLTNTNGYLYTEESYPYVSGSGEVPPCIDHNRTLGAFITSHLMLEADEDVIEAYLREHGPLAIAVDATSFLSYRGGILTQCSAMRLNHGVLLVGYHNAKSDNSSSDSVGDASVDANDNVSYWIIKNSWGEDWGEDGFIRIKKGVNACMMRDHVVTALVDKDAPEPPTPSTHAPPTTRPPRPTPTPGSYSIHHEECSDYSCHECQEEDLEIGKCVLYGIGSDDDVVYVKAEYGLAKAILHFFYDESCEYEKNVRAYPTNSCLLRLSGSARYTVQYNY